jgi:hypothetical protein
LLFDIKKERGQKLDELSDYLQRVRLHCLRKICHFDRPLLVEDVVYEEYLPEPKQQEPLWFGWFQQRRPLKPTRMDRKVLFRMLL